MRQAPIGQSRHLRYRAGIVWPPFFRLVHPRVHATGSVAPLLFRLRSTVYAAATLVHLAGFLSSCLPKEIERCDVTISGEGFKSFD